MVEHKSMLGWPVAPPKMYKGGSWQSGRLYLYNNKKEEQYKLYEDANVAYSILTDGTLGNDDDDDITDVADNNSFKYSPLFGGVFNNNKKYLSYLENLERYISDNKKISKKKVFNNINLTNLCNDEGNGILYKKKVLKDGTLKTVYGNIWIKLTGSRDCDFVQADEIAGSIGLLTKTIKQKKYRTPNGYTWHHVYMGWLNSFDIPGNPDNPGNINEFELQGLDIKELTKRSNIKLKISDKTDVYDATEWRTNWNPNLHLALMQLVYTPIHAFCCLHSGCVAQYKATNNDYNYCTHSRESK